jgi:DNA-binding CsgD family transcriptional regulator
MMKRWTIQDEEYLRSNWTHTDISTLISHLNRSKKSIVNKAAKLGLLLNENIYHTSQKKHWTKEEDRILKDYYNIIAVQDIHVILPHRSIKTITERARNLGLTNPVKNWSEDEIEYLMDKWGNMTITNISRKLDRSENAVLLKAHKLGLKNQVIANGTYLRPKDIADILNIEIRNVYYWLDHGYIDYKKLKIRSMKKYQIGIDSFKDFLDKHQNLWNSKRADMTLIKSCFINCSTTGNYILPKWMEEKISGDAMVIKMKEYKNWTTKEEEKLSSLLEQGKNNKEIARILNRSIYSVQGKVRHIKNTISAKQQLTNTGSRISVAM